MEYEWLTKAAKLTGNDLDIMKIQKIKKLAEEQKFYITLWGHYSAGKSKLINNLLGKDLLPVQTRETTSALTYIQYGEEEKCNIFYENDTVKSHQISVLKDIFQNTNEEYHVKEIDHIEVYIQNDLLKNGLVLVDTPGVNTIIQKHQALAVAAIEQSGRILYILGNAPSNIDREFIKQIHECGVQINFVRTKCDKFISTEENAESALKMEQSEIESFLNETVNYIAVSNEIDSKWFRNIEDVKILLQHISSDISIEIDRMNKSRIQSYATKYYQALDEEVSAMEEIITGNFQKYDTQIEQYEKEIKALDQRSLCIENNVVNKIKNLKKESQKEIDSLISRNSKNFNSAIEDINEDTNDITAEVEQKYDQYVSTAVKDIQQLLNSYFDNMIEKETYEIQKEVSINTDDIPVPTYSEVRQENSNIISMYRTQLLETKSRIQSILEQKDSNNYNINELKESFDEEFYKERLEELNQKLKEIPSEAAMRISDEQGIQPSSFFKALGTAADFTLFYLSGDEIFEGVKAVANTRKIAQTLHKAGQVGNVVIKGGNYIGKNANIIDKVRDITYSINTVMKKRPYSTQKDRNAAKNLVNTVAQNAKNSFHKMKKNKKEGNVFDALSVAYWTEKFGRNFDSDPKMEIDKEMEAQKNQLRKQIKEQQEQLSKQRIHQKKTLGLLQNKEQELSERLKEEQLREKIITVELEKQQKIVVAQARKKSMQKYIREYKEYYLNTIIEISDAISKQYFHNANENISMYVARQTSSLKEDIKTKRTQIEKLLTLRNSDNQKIQEKLKQYKELVEQMEMINK